MQDNNVVPTYPRNLLATDLVKCLNCGEFYHINEIQSHFETHANSYAPPKPKVPIIHPSGVAPIDLNHCYSKSSSSTLTSLDVLTVHPAELPHQDIKRHSITLPLHQNISQNALLPVPNSQMLMTDLLSGNTGSDLSSRAPFENVQVGQYEQKVNVQSSVLPVIQKSVPMFKNRPEVSYATDRHKDSRVPDSQKKIIMNKPGYTIASHGDRVAVHEDDFGKLDLTMAPGYLNTKTKRDPDAMTNTYNSDGQPIRISRRSKIGTQVEIEDEGAQCFGISCGWLRPKKEQVPAGHTHEAGANLTCPSCGGFYCQVCKSTVPPQYRRPPGYEPQSTRFLTQDKQRHPMSQSRTTIFKTPQRK